MPVKQRYAKRETRQKSEREREREKYGNFYLGISIKIFINHKKKKRTLT